MQKYIIWMINKLSMRFKGIAVNNRTLQKLFILMEKHILDKLKILFHME